MFRPEDATSTITGRSFGAMPITGFNLYSVLVAVVGAVVVQVVYHAIFGCRAVY